MTEGIGMLAATCTTVAFVPQVLQVWRTRSAEDISLGMYAVFCGGVALWLLYGSMIGSAPLLIANGVTLVLAASVLAMKLVWGRGAGPLTALARPLRRRARARRASGRAPRSRPGARSRSAAARP